MASKAQALEAATAAAVHGKNPVKAAKGVLHSGGNEVTSPTISIPKQDFVPSNGAKTPKTPADEGIEFFENAAIPGEQPIQVYELKLEPDGGPSKEKSVCFFLRNFSCMSQVLMESFFGLVHTSTPAVRSLRASYQS